jgi:hypothetical protein
MLSRFAITADQATSSSNLASARRLILANDIDFLNNPYLLYELSRHSADPISVTVVDRGVFPKRLLPFTKCRRDCVRIC